MIKPLVAAAIGLFLGVGIGWYAGYVNPIVKAKSAAPGVEGGRPNKSFLAVTLAGLVGALTFWRRFRRAGSET